MYKEYTVWRQFLAWIGFISLLFMVGTIVLKLTNIELQLKAIACDALNDNLRAFEECLSDE